MFHQSTIYWTIKRTQRERDKTSLIHIGYARTNKWSTFSSISVSLAECISVKDREIYLSFNLCVFNVSFINTKIFGLKVHGIISCALLLSNSYKISKYVKCIPSFLIVTVMTCPLINNFIFYFTYTLFPYTYSIKSR